MFVKDPEYKYWLVLFVENFELKYLYYIPILWNHLLNNLDFTKFD